MIEWVELVIAGVFNRVDSEWKTDIGNLEIEGLAIEWFLMI